MLFIVSCKQRDRDDIRESRIRCKRTEEEQRFYKIKPAQRWTMAAMYLGLIAALVFRMHVALAQLQGHGIHPEMLRRCSKRRRSGTSRSNSSKQSIS